MPEHCKEFTQARLRIEKFEYQHSLAFERVNTGTRAHCKALRNTSTLYQRIEYPLIGKVTTKFLVPNKQIHIFTQLKIPACT
jgi:hypothetical protein